MRQLDKKDETTNHGKKRASRAKTDNSSSEDRNDKQRKRVSLSSLSRIDPKKAAFMHRHGLDLSLSESDNDDVEGDAGQTGVCCYL